MKSISALIVFVLVTGGFIACAVWDATESEAEPQRVPPRLETPPRIEAPPAINPPPAFRTVEPVKAPPVPKANVNPYR